MTEDLLSDFNSIVIQLKDDPRFIYLDETLSFFH